MQYDQNRRFAILIFFGLLLFILLARLFYIQVISKEYKLASNSISVVEQTIMPARGMIYDRKDSLLVYNAPVYDIYFKLKQIKDTLGVCELLDIERDYFLEKIDEAKAKNFWYKPYPLLRNLSEEDFGGIQEELYRFNELQVVSSAQRRYNVPHGALLLGYMGEVNDAAIEKSNYYYELGDYSGVTGIESSYEDSLKGYKGKRYILRDKHNVLHGSFQEGQKDIAAVPGLDIYTTLSAELQSYGEQLMQNKIGSVVAIEPATGQILAMISSPTYNPNWLVGRQRGKYISALLQDTLKPMFNRAIMAEYPPGSTFKPLASVIALDQGAVTTDFTFPCNGGYSMNRALSRFNGNVRKALDEFRDGVLSFGYGTKFNIGVNGVHQGSFPSSEYYDKIYSGWNWGPMTIISLSIGQGETLSTTLQMANSVATIANKGYYYEPHLVKRFSDGTKVNEALEKVMSPFNQTSFEPVINGMERTFIDGTAAASKIDSIAACGKTGTAENPHGKDHSIFVAFAPKENPQIAIAVIVENSGYGSTYAAPIASLMMEKHIKDSISGNRKYVEQRMYDADLVERKDKEYLTLIAEQTAEQELLKENQTLPN